ncbi:hypothetical protein [Streptacidiphilus sp. P02-A3a]|uniref:hypothetical protein n=1 Tax=Streptacidiphilus sp. P02-A3a TaxID=2704468 RepID=UPI0015FBB4CA|nr:hypothetical protein [Streptacidiphilus sp. P02-A3a]QMU72134.1 hypothetical protein GXP74_31745 [Streptacidiphilus sp. P02-A3a]
MRSGWLLNRDSPGGGQSRQDTRVVPIGTYQPNGPLSSRGGCLPSPGTFPLTAGSGAMQCTIGYGRALIMGAGASQGAYPVAQDTVETLTIADGDATYPRIDAIMVRVYDSAFDSSGRYQAALEIVQGTPAAQPVAPVASNTAEKLYEVSVPAGASAGNGGINWTTGVADRRRYTVGLGGITPSGWGNSWAGVYAGQYRDNNGVLERWDGSASWVPYLDGNAEGAWTTYTPTWSGLTALGASVSRGRYRKVGRTVDAVGVLEWGSGSSLGTGNVTASLPVAALAAGGWLGWEGSGKFRQADSLWRPVSTFVEPSATTVALWAPNASHQYVSVGTAGYTWSNSTCHMRFQVRYETAS